MHWGRSKPFWRSHIYIVISAELWEPGNPVFGLFLNRRALWKSTGTIRTGVKEVPFASPLKLSQQIFSVESSRSLFVSSDLSSSHGGVLLYPCETTHFCSLYLCCKIATFFVNENLIAVFVFPGQRRLTQGFILLHSQKVSTEESRLCVRK